MHAIAAASETERLGLWAHLAVFVLMVVAFAGIPVIGAQVVGWASVLASRES